MTPISAKKSLEKSAREVLFGSRLFPAARDVYQSVFDRDKLATRKRMLEFYAGFISRGDLVFDVGANIGVYSDAFQTLGARVVAIEPNPVCCERLELIAKRSDLIIENCAVGSEQGAATMNVCSDPTLSTLSSEWYESARTSPTHSGEEWLGTIEVRVATLNSLAEKHGVPSFIKIDVEGFEDRVLAGMSFAPKALSFEFHFALLNIARACLSNPVLRNGYSFNYIDGMDPEFRLPTWVDASAIERILAEVQSRTEYGDVFCRKVDKD
jgi:FkbM family methyltransferase